MADQPKDKLTTFIGQALTVITHNGMAYRCGTVHNVTNEFLVLKGVERYILPGGLFLCAESSTTKTYITLDSVSSFFPGVLKEVHTE